MKWRSHLELRKCPARRNELQEAPRQQELVAQSRRRGIAVLATDRFGR